MIFFILESIKQKWKNVLFAVIALIVCACSIKSCSNVIEGISSLISEKSEGGKEYTPRLSMESIKFTTKDEAKTITIIGSTSVARWKSSNPDVAIVNNGKVIAVSNGKSTIEATIDDKLVGRCEVVVEINPESNSDEVEETIVTQKQDVIANSAKIDRKRTYKHGNSGSIKIGTDFAIPIIKTGNPTVTFSSLNPAVATIDNNGTVTAKGKGTTEIIVLCNGVETDKFILKVTENEIRSE